MEQVQEKIENLEIKDQEVTQAGTEQQTKLTPNQLKKLKQKQKKAEKKEQEKQELQKEQETQDDQNENGQEQDAFQLEVQWCVKQLKLGLLNNNLDKEQESDSVPLVAKRHLMRVIFGDYRKLMKTMK